MVSILPVKLPWISSQSTIDTLFLLVDVVQHHCGNSANAHPQSHWEMLEIKTLSYFEGRPLILVSIQSKEGVSSVFWCFVQVVQCILQDDM